MLTYDYTFETVGGALITAPVAIIGDIEMKSIFGDSLGHRKVVFVMTKAPEPFVTHVREDDLVYEGRKMSASKVLRLYEGFLEKRDEKPCWSTNPYVIEGHEKLNAAIRGFREFLIKYGKAWLIATYWKRAMSDPSYAMCRRRLLKEFGELYECT